MKCIDGLSHIWHFFQKGPFGHFRRECKKCGRSEYLVSGILVNGKPVWAKAVRSA